MGEIGVFDKIPQKWFPYDEDTEVELMFVDKQVLRKLQKKAAKNARLTKMDYEELANNALGKAAVKGWRKVDDHSHPGFTLKGEPLPFNPENVHLLMTRDIDFSAFVNANSIDPKVFREEAEEVSESEATVKKVCKKCKEENTAEAKVCVKCGEPFEEETEKND